MANNRDDDEIGDIYDDKPWWKLDEGDVSALPPWWDVKPDRRKVDGTLPARRFELPHHHRLVISGYGRSLLPSEPGQRQGFPVLCSPGGYPVARLHGDLKPGEVSWVLR